MTTTSCPALAHALASSAAMTELGSGSGGNTAETSAIRMCRCLRRLLLHADLLRDPAVGPTKPFLQRTGRLPAELLVDELIVGPPPADALRPRDVPHFELLTRDAGGEARQSVRSEEHTSELQS